MARSLPYADMDKILSLSKRRGFVFQSGEIYGGLASTWDYGPLGVELKRNVKEAWWQSVISVGTTHWHGRGQQPEAQEQDGRP